MPHQPGHLPNNPLTQSLQLNLEEEQQQTESPETFSALGRKFGLTSDLGQASQLAEEGTTPIFYPEEIEQRELIDISPNEAQQDAIRQAARAKISAARNQLDAARSVEDQATRQLVGSVLGEQLFNALTGASVPTGQQQAEQAQQGAMRDIIEAARNVATTEETAQAEADLQQAQLQAQAQRTERKINEDIRQQNMEIQQANAERTADMFNTIQNTLESERKLDRQQIQSLREMYNTARSNLLELGTPEQWRNRLDIAAQRLTLIQRKEKSIRQGIDPETGLEFKQLSNGAQKQRNLLSSVLERKQDILQDVTNFKQNLSQSRALEQRSNRIGRELAQRTGVDLDIDTEEEPDRPTFEEKMDRLTEIDEVLALTQGAQQAGEQQDKFTPSSTFEETTQQLPEQVTNELRTLETRASNVRAGEITGSPREQSETINRLIQDFISLSDRSPGGQPGIFLRNRIAEQIEDLRDRREQLEEQIISDLPGRGSDATQGRQF